MQVTPGFKKKSRILICPKGLLIALVTLTAFLSWLPARVGQQSSRKKAPDLNARGLGIVLGSDPNLLLINIWTSAALTSPPGKMFQGRNVSLQEVAKDPGRFGRDKTLALLWGSGYKRLKAANLLAEHGHVFYLVDAGMRARRTLHPKAKTPAEGTAPKEPGAAGHTPGTAKPSSQREKKDRHPPRKFFDNNLGC